MRKRGVIVIGAIMLTLVMAACSSNPDKGTSEEKRTQEEITTSEVGSASEETTVQEESSEEISTEDEIASVNPDEESSSVAENETKEYETGPEDVLASQQYSVGSIILHMERKGKEVIKYSVQSGSIPFNAGMMMFINGIPQSFTDEEGNSMYISYVNLKSSDAKINYYTCDFNNVEEADSYVCIEKNMVMPDIMTVKRKGFYMGHLQSLTAGWAHEVQCDKFTDVDLGTVEFEVSKKDAATHGETNFNAYVGEDLLYGTVVERKDAKTVQIRYSSYKSGDVVLAFWGNNVPVQVGEHMYYKFHADGAKVYTYTFELDEELVNNIDNFFVTATCLCEDMTYDNVDKSSTCIFVDQYE